VVLPLSPLWELSLTRLTPVWGSAINLVSSHDLLAVFKGATSKGMEGKGKRGDE